jgi:hypothetical protein
MRTTFALLAAAIAVPGCSDDLAPANQLSGVRILATSVDIPYARPGETVTLETLAVDARADKPAPMRISYVPAVCFNPAADDPTNCYAALIAAFPARSNLDAELVAGERFTVRLPDDIIATAAPAKSGPPRGIGFAFVMACAGHVERLESDAQYPTRPPFGCFDGADNQLGKDDFVFGFVRLYAFTDLRNDNPAIDALSYQGEVVGSTGFSIAHCAETDFDECPKTYLDTRALDSAQEPDPAATTSARTYREQIWVSYYVTGGKMEADLTVLYDSVNGKLTDSKAGITAASPVGDYTLYAVLRDNRGGVSWKIVPFKIY